MDRKPKACAATLSAREPRGTPTGEAQALADPAAGTTGTRASEPALEHGFHERRAGQRTSLPLPEHHRRVHARMPGDRGFASLPAVRVIEVLERLRSERGLPDVIVTDNGTEFTSRAFDAWAYARGVKSDFIQPGKPVQNCFVESFNGTFRDDCLNLHWFTSLAAAKVQVESWRREYNTERLHSSLKRLTPARFAELHQSGGLESAPITNPAVR